MANRNYSIILPPDIMPESPESVTLVDDQTITFTPQFGRGWMQRNSFADPRWQLRRRYKGLRQADLGRIKTALAEAQGTYKTIYASPSHATRGSFPTGELLSNYNFASGTTGWTNETQSYITAQDYTLSVRHNAVSGSAMIPKTAFTTGLTQWAAYAMRAFVTLHGDYETNTTAATWSLRDYSVFNPPNQSWTGNLWSQLFLTPTTQLKYALAIVFPSALLAPDTFYTVHYTSLTRCMVLDNNPNSMTQSDDLSSADWTKTRCSIVANSVAAPDGTTTADTIVEDTSASTSHIVNPLSSPSRTSAAEYLFITGYFRRASGTRDIYLRVGSDGSNFSQVIFDLSAGTAGSVTNSGTALRGWATIANVGPTATPWYRCSLMMYAQASTTITGQYNLVNAGNATYTGDGTSGVYAWRCAMGRSNGFPTMAAGTTTATFPDGTAQTGDSILTVSGLPASTDGLLLPGDFVDIAGELKMVTAPLNSAGDGLGFLAIRPRLYGAPAQGTPIIVTNPMGRFVLAGDPTWDAMYGSYGEVELELTEAFSQ